MRGRVVRLQREVLSRAEAQIIVYLVTADDSPHG
jgi:hypothetical protein